jgi:hypothetical protein
MRTTDLTRASTILKYKITPSNRGRKENTVSKLDEVLEANREYVRGIRTDRLIGTNNEGTKVDIKALFLELVGEDEVIEDDDTGKYKVNKYLVAENRLRREIRKKINAL